MIRVFSLVKLNPNRLTYTLNHKSPYGICEEFHMIFQRLERENQHVLRFCFYKWTKIGDVISLLNFIDLVLFNIFLTLYDNLI